MSIPHNTDSLLIVEGHCSQNPLQQLLTLLGNLLLHWQQSRCIRFEDSVVCAVHVSGTWDAMAKLELQVQALKHNHDIQCNLIRIAKREPENTLYAYRVQVISPNIPGNVVLLLQFFLELGVGIDEMSTEPYCSHTHTPMITMGLDIEVPHHILLADLRERLLQLCDNHNMDVMLEPLKR